MAQPQFLLSHSPQQVRSRDSRTVESQYRAKISSSDRGPLASAYPESALKHHLGHSHEQKHRTHNRVQSEESDIDPIQTSTASDPMFHHEAAYDQEPADTVGEAKTTKQPEPEQQRTHEHVGQKCCV